MNFGKNCKALRENRGMSQSELADKVGVRPPMINYIEAGTKLPSLALGLRIADVLGTTVDALCKEDVA